MLAVHSLGASEVTGLIHRKHGLARFPGVFCPSAETDLLTSPGRAWQRRAQCRFWLSPSLPIPDSRKRMERLQRSGSAFQDLAIDKRLAALQPTLHRGHSLSLGLGSTELTEVKRCHLATRPQSQLSPRQATCPGRATGNLMEQRFPSGFLTPTAPNTIQSRWTRSSSRPLPLCIKRFHAPKSGVSDNDEASVLLSSQINEGFEDSCRAIIEPLRGSLGGRTGFAG